MKKVFYVERTDEVDYDEYDSCIVVAESKEQVIDIIEKNNKIKSCCGYWDKGERAIEEVNLENSEVGILHSSYRAG